MMTPGESSIGKFRSFQKSMSLVNRYLSNPEDIHIRRAQIFHYFPTNVVIGIEMSLVIYELYHVQWNAKTRMANDQTQPRHVTCETWLDSSVTLIYNIRPNLPTPRAAEGAGLLGCLPVPPKITWNWT